MKKAVLLLSGGPDSATMAYWLKAEGYDLDTLTFCFGEEGAAEKRAAQAVAKQLGLSNHHVNFVEPLTKLYKNDGQPIHILRKVPDPKLLVRAYGSGIALSLAASYAAEQNIDELFYAVHKDDRQFLDNNEEYFELISRAITMERGKEFKIRVPFLDMTKAELMSLGRQLGVPFDATWSCGRKGEVHCGTCDPCQCRQQAFKGSSVADPTIYQAPVVI